MAGARVDANGARIGGPRSAPPTSRKPTIASPPAASPPAPSCVPACRPCPRAARPCSRVGQLDVGAGRQVPRGRFSLPANTSGDGLPSSVNARGSAPAGQRSGASVAAAASTLPAPRRASAGSVTACASSAPAGYSSAPWASCTAAARMVPAGSVSGCARVPATGNTVPAANCVCDNGSSKLSMAPTETSCPAPATRRYRAPPGRRGMAARRTTAASPSRRA